MSDWRKLAATGRWREINWIHLDPAECIELLELVKQAVPITNAENGIEIRSRHRYPEEIGDPKTKAAAEILYLGELERSIKGDPPEASVNWKNTLEDVKPLLTDLAEAAEVTDGAPEMSRKAHAEHALAHLKEIDLEWRYACGQLYPPNDVSWLEEAFASIANLAFFAGRRIQVAIGKEFEVDAVRGQKVASGLQEAARQTNSQFSTTRSAIMTRMSELTTPSSDQSKKYTVSAAAKKCEAEGLGPAGGVRKTWYRYKNSWDT